MRYTNNRTKPVSLIHLSCAERTRVFQNRKKKKNRESNTSRAHVYKTPDLCVLIAITCNKRIMHALSHTHSYRYRPHALQDVYVPGPYPYVMIYAYIIICKTLIRPRPSSYTFAKGEKPSSSDKWSRGRDLCLPTTTSTTRGDWFVKSRSLQFAEVRRTALQSTFGTINLYLPIIRLLRIKTKQ